MTAGCSTQIAVNHSRDYARPLTDMSAKGTPVRGQIMNIVGAEIILLLTRVQEELHTSRLDGS